MYSSQRFSTVFSRPKRHLFISVLFIQSADLTHYNSRRQKDVQGRQRKRKTKNSWNQFQVVAATDASMTGFRPSASEAFMTRNGEYRKCARTIPSGNWFINCVFLPANVCRHFVAFAGAFHLIISFLLHRMVCRAQMATVMNSKLIQANRHLYLSIVDAAPDQMLITDASAIGSTTYK